MKNIIIHFIYDSYFRGLILDCLVGIFLLFIFPACLFTIVIWDTLYFDFGVDLWECFLVLIGLLILDYKLF